jgi:hypothetical protein
MLKKVYVVSVLCTAVLAYATWAWLAGVDGSAADGGTTGVLGAVLHTFGTQILLVLSSSACFLAMQKGLLWCIDHSTLLKKVFFADEYIEGYWVGYYHKTMEDGIRVVRFQIERIKQTSAELFLQGWSYDVNERLKATWNTKGHPIQIINDELIFLYTNTHHDRTEATTSDGHCYYTMEKTDKKRLRFSYPDLFIGASYNFDGGHDRIRIRRTTFLKKIGDINAGITDKQKIDAARKFWEAHTSELTSSLTE